MPLPMPILPDGVTVQRTGLILPDTLTLRDWSAIAPAFMTAQRAIQWALGDFTNYGSQRWGRTYEDLAKLTGYEVQTLTNYAYVARQIEISRRRENLAYTIHAEVAGLSIDQQEWWLDQAEIARLTAAEVRQGVRRQREENAAAEARVNAKATAPVGALADRVVIEQEREPGPRRDLPEPDRPSGSAAPIRRGLETGPRNEAMLAQVVRPSQPSPVAELVAAPSPITNAEVVGNYDKCPDATLRFNVEAGPITLSGPAAILAKQLWIRHNVHNLNATYQTPAEYVAALLEREAVRAGVKQ